MQWQNEGAGVHLRWALGDPDLHLRHAQGDGAAWRGSYLPEYLYRLTKGEDDEARSSKFQSLEPNRRERQRRKRAYSGLSRSKRQVKEVHKCWRPGWWQEHNAALGDGEEGILEMIGLKAREDQPIERVDLWEYKDNSRWHKIRTRGCIPDRLSVTRAGSGCVMLGKDLILFRGCDVGLNTRHGSHNQAIFKSVRAHPVGAHHYATK